MQSAALKLWSQDLVGNYDKAQATVYERAKANGLAALGQWSRGRSLWERLQPRCLQQHEKGGPQGRPFFMSCCPVLHRNRGCNRSHGGGPDQGKPASQSSSLPSATPSNSGVEK